MRKVVTVLMKPIRILFRSLRDSFKSFARNFSLSLASIMCVVITLLLVSIALVFSANVNQSIDNIESELSIIVYLDTEITEERIQELNEEFSSLEGINTVVLKTKEEWKNEMIEADESFATILDYLEENPLSDSFTITVYESEEISKLAEYITQTNDVDTVKYGEGMVESIISTFDIVQTGTIIAVVALILVTVFLIGNTIKLTIFSRRNEIEIMRLVGASNTTIKMPFIFEGLLVGCLGSVIPICITVYGYIILYNYFDGILFTNLIKLIDPYNFIFIIALSLLLIGATVGVLGSYRAVRKYLKV